MRKELFLALLPIGVTLGLTGCSTTPDVAAYLKLQCEANPNMEIATQSVEMVPGQIIEIGNRTFDLTDKGRLRLTDSSSSRVVEFGQRDFIVNGANPYDNNRYLVTLDFEETGNKTQVNVSLNCKNPSEAR